MTKNQAAIRNLFKVSRDSAGNLPSMPGIFPDYPAPIVRNVDGGRELAMARWGMPSSTKALFDATKKRAAKLEANGKPVDFKELLRNEPDKGTTNIRNVTSRQWKPWLGVESRCVVPMSSFSEFNKDAGGDIWFAVDESRPLVCFAGLWTNWTSVRKVSEGEVTTDVFGFLTTKPNAEVEAAGCEALLRWQHPERGLVPPLQFIPLAEESGLIAEIGAWVLENACIEAASWRGAQRISVNVSPLQFHVSDLPKTILSALARSGLSPARLEIEVTETILVSDAERALAILRQIRAMGVKIALDDFGTGYSSLSYLRSFPFDKIKIDKSFVDDLVRRGDNQVIVQAIRDIATGLNMSITAKGVETQEQASHLRLMGCQELQGYLFSRPKPAEQLDLLANHSPLSSDARCDVALRG